MLYILNVLPLLNWLEVRMAITFGVIDFFHLFVTYSRLAGFLASILILIITLRLSIWKALTYFFINLRISLTNNSYVVHHSLFLVHTPKLAPDSPFAFAYKVKHLRFLCIAIPLLWLLEIRIYLQLSRIIRNVFRLFNQLCG